MSLDIVIPAYNEQDRIDRTLRAYRAGFPQSDVRLHIALDGCGDGTPEIVRRHQAADDRIVLHAYPRMGKGGVLMETFRRCEADYVAFVDADCATPPAELARLVECVQDVDGVIANRRHPASFTPAPRASGRSLTSTGFAWGIRRLFDLPFTDTQCGAKVVRREVAELVVPYMSSRDFLFDVDLLILTARLGFRILEVPTLWIDQAGSKVGARRDALRMLKSAVRLWIHHSTLPVEPATENAPAGAGSMVSLAQQSVSPLPVTSSTGSDRAA